jgi:hypothetical protein
MKHFLFVLLLICVTALPVMAGAIPTDGSPTPPPAGTNQTTNLTSLGDIPSGGFLDTMSEAAVSALLTTLGLASI